MHVGQYVQRGTKIATLVRVDPLRVELAVPEAAVPSVRRGQKVAFAVQTYPGRTFEGTIAYVGPALKAESRALVVEALVPNAARSCSPASSPPRESSCRPALRRRSCRCRPCGPRAGSRRLFVIKNERAELRLVQLGQRTGQARQFEIVARPRQRPARAWPCAAARQR